MILEEMTMGEFEAGLGRTKTILVPFGSVEQHGNHLPLATDTIQAYEVGKKAALLIPLFVAPPVHYGNCRSTSCHPGTISITTATLKGLVCDIVTSCRLSGLRKFILLTGHAGGAHRMALQEAGEDLMSRFGDIRIAVVTEYELARTAGKGIIETSDSHAGEIETSRIMHSHPHLVKGEGEKESPDFPQWILVRNKRQYWPGGVWGDPTKASSDKGRRIEGAVVEEIVSLVKKMESFQE